MKNTRIHFGVWVSIGLLFMSILLIFLPYNDWIEGKTIGKYIFKINSYNELGEFVGGITAPIISIAAFILLFLTYQSQKKELNETQTILYKQTKTSEHQKFETTFFNLLESFKSLVNSLGKEHKGPRLFEQINKELTKKYQDIKTSLDRENNVQFGMTLQNEIQDDSKLYSKLMQIGGIEREIMLAKLSYKHIYNKYHLYLDSYFRHLYHILKFIDNQYNEENIHFDKQFETFKSYKRYADILQANLSSYEMTLLFYNLLFFEKMKKLVEKFEFIENLSLEDLIENDHRAFFKFEIASRNLKLVIN